MTSSSGSFFSPGYPGNYYDNTNCRYTIKVPQDKRIVLTVHGYSMEACCDFLDILEAGGLIERLTGHQPRNTQLVSYQNQLDLRFTTDGSVVRGGFIASYHSFPAGKLYYTSSKCLGERLDVHRGSSDRKNGQVLYRGAPIMQ